MPGDRLKRRLAAIMMADVAGYGRLMEANDEATLEAMRLHHAEFLDPTIAEFGGRTFKDMGDSFLADFPSAMESVQCAVDIQRGMAQRNAGLPEDRHIKLRIGINLGDVIVDGDDLHGDDVNTASRMVGLVQPGAIVCSEGIRHQVGGKLNVQFIDQGEKELRNIAPPIHTFLVHAGSTPSESEARSRSSGDLQRRGKPSVAVLPFANMSGDPEQDYFADGITEDIIIDLSQVSELFVISRNAAFRYKGNSGDLAKIANELGVAYVVHGTVRKAGGSVRITAQLVDGGSGGQLWAERYDRDLTDIFELQDEITAAVVGQLKVKLMPGERQAMAQAQTSNVEAYTHYLKGREFFHRGSKPNYMMAKMMFAKAIELDPNYARAYAGMADTGAFLYMDYSEDVAASVLQNSERALALDPNLAEARASRALALSVAHRYAEAEIEFEKAQALDPNQFEVRFFHGRSCYAQGKLEEAALHWERAAEVKADDFQSLILLDQVYNSLDRPDEARRASQRGIERAEREFARNPHNPRPAYLIATALAKMGDVELAEAWAERALAIAPDDFLTQYNIACFYSVAGRLGPALDLLEKLYPLCNADMHRWIATDSDLEPLHNDHRWRRLVKPVDDPVAEAIGQAQRIKS